MENIQPYNYKSSLNWVKITKKPKDKDENLDSNIQLFGNNNIKTLTDKCELENSSKKELDLDCNKEDNVFGENFNFSKEISKADELKNILDQMHSAAIVKSTTLNVRKEKIVGNEIKVPNIDASQIANSQVIPAEQATLQSIQPSNITGAHVEQINLMPALASTSTTAQQSGMIGGASTDRVMQLQPGGTMTTKTTNQQKCRLPCTCPNCTDSDRNRDMTGKRQHVCHIPDCGKNYGKVSNLRAHLKSHTDERPFACSWESCNAKFACYGELQQHNLTHTSEKGFQCPECNKKFMRSDALTNHIKTHTGEKRFQCPECTKKFGRSDVLRNHIKIHIGEKTFQCPECTKKFGRSDVLRNHIKIHIGEKRFQCPECTKKFIRSDYLSNHIKIHAGEKRFQCPECTKKFRRSDYLNNHIKIHTSEKMFQCPECTKKFIRSDHFANHIKIHTDEKRFQCPECPKKFIRSDYLTNHMRIHAVEKRFKCPECNKKFIRSDYLSKHLKTHTGEKRFQCPECTKKFGRSDVLSKHLKIHSKIHSKQTKPSRTLQAIKSNQQQQVHVEQAPQTPSSANAVEPLQLTNGQKIIQPKSKIVSPERTQQQQPHQQPHVPVEQAPPTPQQIQLNVSTASNESTTETTKRRRLEDACTCPNCTDSDRNRDMTGKRQHVCHIPGCGKNYTAKCQMCVLT